MYLPMMKTARTKADFPHNIMSNSIITLFSIIEISYSYMLKRKVAILFLSQVHSDLNCSHDGCCYAWLLDQFDAVQETETKYYLSIR